MNPKKSVFIAFAIILTTSVSSAAAAEWPKSSASDLSVFLTVQRFRIYADHCSAEIPPLKPKFDILMENMNSHVQGISKVLLASEEFNGMKDKPVPSRIIDAFKDSFDDLKHNFERRDAAAVCPDTLQNLGQLDDESLKSGLRQILTGIQIMIRNLEREGAR
jgi:hypothetical protein